MLASPSACEQGNYVWPGPKGQWEEKAKQEERRRRGCLVWPPTPDRNCFHVFPSLADTSPRLLNMPPREGERGKGGKWKGGGKRECDANTERGPDKALVTEEKVGDI